jgi:hypothetical protein
MPLKNFTLHGLPAPSTPAGAAGATLFEQDASWLRAHPAERSFIRSVHDSELASGIPPAGCKEVRVFRPLRGVPDTMIREFLPVGTGKGSRGPRRFGMVNPPALAALTARKQVQAFFAKLP